jgi:outer membrane protein
MKNVSLIINVVLLVAVVFLYIDRFSATNNAINEPEKEVKSDSLTVEIDYDIDYINSDSLVKNYQFFVEKREELTDKQQKLEVEYRNRATGLQKEITDFQQTAGSMTMNQARAIEEDLVKKQENLLRYQDNIRTQLIKDENEANREVYKEIDAYLKEYGKEKNLKIVLSYVYGGEILYADNALDVTDEVIRELNNRYSEMAANTEADQNNQPQ